MHRAACIGVLLLASLLALSHRLGAADDHDDFFEAKIRPVLLGTCFRCHGDTKTSGALRVDSRETLLQGGKSGPAIVPGKPDDSLLIKAIQRQADVSAMPPGKDKALRSDQVTDFVEWIKAGAVWPAQSAKFATAKHWAFEPIRDDAPADVRDKAWVKNSIDPFIRSKQEEAGIQPAPAADKRALIRRATFDLTGLPPTPEEVEAFAQDASARAFEAVVDRLLASPAYGERWGRHWLDVVRYADTAGETADFPLPLAWRYRNYVIEAFQADKPYDEFLREQIAGDVLADQGPPERYAERVTATGYLAISRRFGFDSENYQHLTIQDTIDTLGQSVLGLSLGCARCHDHKFDAVSMNDYYALYGIFDSSRYAFPGSEQKQRVRTLTPLLPPSESRAKWREFDSRVAALAGKLANQNQSLSAAVLRSLSDIDGDFELQAPAAGGSNGVLVAPWRYEGKIAVTTAAQSLFKNLYALGKVGASVPADVGAYRIAQALYPRHTRENCQTLFVNLDFRVASADASANGAHRISLGAIGETPAVELVLSSDTVGLRVGERIESLCAVKPNQWHNLQLDLDLQSRTVSGRVGMPGATTEFSSKPFLSDASSVIDFVVLDSVGTTDTKFPAIEFDNFGAQESPIPPVSTEVPIVAVTANEPDYAVLTEQLRTLAGIDGDFELQTNDNPPSSPWNPGPNSQVKISRSSQSPYCNLFPPGELGIHLPNRVEYDGFGLTLANVKPDNNGRLFVSFDFRCGDMDAGGSGSWRFYLGQGAGSSAAVELFFNGSEFFRRSVDVTEAVCPLVIGQWYQVQLTLDLNAKSYDGVLASRAGRHEFSGQLATGWDGTIDYSFVDSYGHMGGVRPSLDADNFVVGEKALPQLDASPVQAAEKSREARWAQIATIRQQLATLQSNIDKEKQEVNTLLAEGPFAMTFGMSEGTPHNVRMQMRGEPDQLGAEVPRGLINVLGGGPLGNETAGSGRLELAHWLTRPENPLTARVMANRIWQHHFGRGLVKTPNDFGVRGLPPTHPELLDHLATQFIRSGWSVKAMHRLIMLSATYQQASDSDVAAFARVRASESKTDVLANATTTEEPNTTDLYISFPRRRLNAEEIRDSILAVSGELDLTPAQEHPFPSPASWGYTQHNPFSAVYDHNKRSVYLMTQRLKRHPFLALFDGADPNASTASRFETTVPTQALFFLNDPFVHAKAERWATRLLEASSDAGEPLELAWRSALGRSPTTIEREEAADFLAVYRAGLATTNASDIEVRSLAAYLRILFGSNEFLFVD